MYQSYTNFFITVNALHVAGGFSAHHQELKTVHTASGICQACLLLDIYQMLCVQFRVPDDGRRNRLKRVEQRFSNFFQVGTTFISQNVLRTTILLGLSDSLCLP